MLSDNETTFVLILPPKPCPALADVTTSAAHLLRFATMRCKWVCMRCTKAAGPQQLRCEGRYPSASQTCCTSMRPLSNIQLYACCAMRTALCLFEIASLMHAACMPQAVHLHAPPQTTFAHAPGRFNPNPRSPSRAAKPLANHPQPRSNRVLSSAHHSSENQLDHFLTRASAASAG